MAHPLPFLSSTPAWAAHGAGRLTETDVHQFLATIGRSSKRAAGGALDGAGLDAARGEFIGRFGIGLLACFVVADAITVVSRTAADHD